MKILNRLWMPCFLLLIVGCESKLKKTKARYTDYDRGYSHLYYHKYDSAFMYFNRYLNNPDDSLQKGKAYWRMGELLWETGDLHGAEENLAGAIRTLDPRDTLHQPEIAYAYNILGNVNLNMKLYDNAVSLYNKAIPFLEGSEFVFEVMNGKATALQKKQNYQEAIAIYDSILLMRPANQLLIARTIDNRARTKWLQDTSYFALPELYEALKIRMDSQYSEGLNASYAHLADYYAGTKRDSALWYANQMRETATKNESPDDILEALDKLIRLSSSSASKDELYTSYKKLNDSLQLSRDTTRNRFAMIRYDFQKSKADNLVLQDQNRNQRLWIYGVIAFAALAVGSISQWYNKRRNRIRQESAIAIRESKLKTSQKVHDVVANGLYRIMNELEHGKTMEKEPLLDKIEALYEKSRDISHEELEPASSQNNQVHDLLMAFDNEQTRVFIVGNVQSFWSRLSALQQHELQLVLTELMVNMNKHSHAKNVVVEFTQEDEKAFINYKDDGVGFGPGPDFGNGLTNTVSRIESLNGDINFGESDKAGVAIAIRLPLQPDKL